MEYKNKTKTNRQRNKTEPFFSQGLNGIVHRGTPFRRSTDRGGISGQLVTRVVCPTPLNTLNCQDLSDASKSAAKNVSVRSKFELISNVKIDLVYRRLNVRT